jgi:hypothetical protein
MKPIVGIALLISLATACARINEDVTNDPKVSHEVGKVYRTEKELLVFSYRDNPKKIKIGDFHWGSILPPRDKVGNKFPVKYNTVILRGILPMGSEFKIEKIVVEGSSSISMIAYYGRLTKCDDPSWANQLVSVDNLMDKLDRPYVFDKNLVQSVTPPPVSLPPDGDLK